MDAARHISFKKPRIRPNYFLAFQVTDERIHKSVQKIQEQLILKEASLQPALIDLPQLHVTFAVAHLATENDVANAIEELNKWEISRKQELVQKQITLTCDGLSSFGASVLFVKFKTDEHLSSLINFAEELEDIFISCGFSEKEGRPFNPHLTIAKLSKDKRLFNYSRKYKAIYKDFIALNHGIVGCQQTVDSVQLLSMSKPKDEKGYYYCSHEIKLSKPDSTAVTHPHVSPRIQKEISALKGETRRYFHEIANEKLLNKSNSEKPEKRNDRYNNFCKLLLLIGAASSVIVCVVRVFHK